MDHLRLSLERGGNFCATLSMGLAILLLPVTSLPLLSKLMGGTLVAPPTIVLVFILAIGWLPVFTLRGGRLPKEMQPFLVFVVVALVASGVGFFLPLPPYRGLSPTEGEIKAIITLLIGGATYLIFSLWHRDTGQIKWTLWLINIGGFLILVWSFAQLGVIRLMEGNYPAFMVRLQAFVSIRSLLNVAFRSRLGGFTYEPSWLAHQLNMLYLPYWLAATVVGYSTARKVLRLSLENFLLAGGIIVLFFTKSRIGLLALLLTVAFIFYRLNARGIDWLKKRIRETPKLARWNFDRWVQGPLVLAFLVVYVALAAGFFALLARFDPRTAHLFSLSAIPRNLFEFANKVDFAERMVYWSIGWSVFARYPLLGVGLGNSGFFIFQHMPNLGYRLPEVMTLVNWAENLSLPNIKSIWIRLLAETGLIGFSLFATWQYLLWQAGKFLRQSRTIQLRTLGWMGAFTLLAFLAEGFSTDSFALPYLWVSMGLLTAAGALARREAT